MLILGFRRDVDVICGLLGNYTASCGNYLPTFRDVSVPSSRVEIQDGIYTTGWIASRTTINYGKFQFQETWDLRSSGILRSVESLFCTDVSRQEIQEVLDFLALEGETDTLSRNVGTELPLNAA
jgi:hypothetical protein